MFKGAKLSQDLRVIKPYFEYSIWILSVMHTQLLTTEKKKSSNFDVNAGLLSTVWTKMFCQNGRNSHFLRMMHSTKL